MSHTTTLKADIRDIRAIRSAVQELKQKGVKVDLLENTKPRMYYSHQHPENSRFVLHLPESRYDVGLDQGADGKFTMAFDAWAGEIAKHLGDNRVKGQGATVAKFMQSYTKHAAINAAQAKGYTVTGTTVDAKTGEVLLTINVPN